MPTTMRQFYLWSSICCRNKVSETLIQRHKKAIKNSSLLNRPFYYLMNFMLVSMNQFNYLFSKSNKLRTQILNIWRNEQIYSRYKTERLTISSNIQFVKGTKTNARESQRPRVRTNVSTVILMFWHWFWETAKCDWIFIRC